MLETGSHTTEQGFSPALGAGAALSLLCLCFWFLSPLPPWPHLTLSTPGPTSAWHGFPENGCVRQVNEVMAASVGHQVVRGPEHWGGLFA